MDRRYHLRDLNSIRMQPPPETAWHAWTPQELAERLKEATSAWHVAGGWALDLWHGEQTREHEDLEFAVLSEDVAYFRSLLPDLEFFTARDGALDHLESTVAPSTEVNQLWGADIKQGCWRVEMMIERGTPDLWIYRRNPTIRMPRTNAVHRSLSGIPYLAPANVLLFKAKYRREKDEEDFRSALPELPASEKANLRTWLEKAHPGHEWIDSLS